MSDVIGNSALAIEYGTVVASRTRITTLIAWSRMAASTAFQTAYCWAQPVTQLRKRYLETKKARVCPMQALTQTIGIPTKPNIAPPANVSIELGKNTAAHAHYYQYAVCCTMRCHKIFLNVVAYCCAFVYTPDLIVCECKSQATVTTHTISLMHPI